MTREEAIKELQCYARQSYGYLSDAFVMAIAALREQLTTNCHQLEPVTNRNGLNRTESDTVKVVDSDQFATNLQQEASNQQITESLQRNGSSGSEEAAASKNQVTSDKTSDKNSNTSQRSFNASNALGVWISVEDRLPPDGERVLTTDGAFVGEIYINKRGKWQRYNVNDSALLMALDILWWMPMPKPPEVDAT